MLLPLTIMVSPGKSSLVMVPTAAVVVSPVYPGPATSARETVSSVSMVLSFVGSMFRIAVAEPAANMIVLPVPGVAPV